jgi:serine/threonine protein kinase
VVAGLKYLHHQNVFHGDIKPQVNMIYVKLSNYIIIKILNTVNVFKEFIDK